MTGQEFAGRFVAGDGGAARASFAIESDHVVITGPDGRKHRWSVHEIAITAVSSPRFQFDIAGEKAVFEADSPARFLFEFGPALRTARQLYPTADPAAQSPEAAPARHGGDDAALPATEVTAAPVETLLARAEDGQIELVIDLRPQAGQEPEPGPSRSLSDVVRQHNRQTVGDAPAADLGAGASIETGTGPDEPATSGEPEPRVQLREPWDTITPKLAERSAHPEPEVDQEGTQGPDQGLGTTEQDEGDQPAPDAAVAEDGDETAAPERFDDVQRFAPFRPGPGIPRTGHGELAQAAQDDHTDAPPGTSDDISHGRERVHEEPENEAAPRGLFAGLRRRRRSRRRPRTDQAPTPDPLSTPARTPDAEAVTTPPSAGSGQAAGTAVDASTEPDTPEPATADAGDRVEPLPPPTEDAAQPGPEPEAGSRPSARSDLLRLAARRRRAYRGRKPG